MFLAANNASSAKAIFYLKHRSRL